MGLKDLFRKKPDKPDENSHKAEASAGGREPAGRMEGHWGILCDSPQEVQDLCMKAAEKGQQMPAAPLNGNAGFGLLLEDGPFREVCTVSDSGQILTFYPMSAGKKHRVVYLKTVASNETFEGDILLGMGPAAFHVFDPLFFRNHATYGAEKNYDFALSGIAYNVWKAGDDKATGPDGRELSMKGMAGLFPIPDAGPAEYAFRSPVKAVDRLVANGKPILRLTLTLFRLSDENDSYGDVDYFVYVRQNRINGYLPAVADDVQGTMWLQGQMVD